MVGPCLIETLKHQLYREHEGKYLANNKINRLNNRKREEAPVLCIENDHLDFIQLLKRAKAVGLEEIAVLTAHNDLFGRM